MQAKSKPVDTATAADLGVATGSQQVVASVAPVPARAAGEIVEDEGEAFQAIVAKLEEVKVI